MRALTPTRRWLLVLILLSVTPFFFVGGPDWQSAPLYRQVWNAGHIGFFALTIVLIRQHVNLDSPLRWLFATLIAAAIGLSIEIVQMYVGREFSYQDIYLDLLGVWIGLSWTQKPLQGIWPLRIASLVLLTPLAWTIIEAGRLQLNSLYRFPTITSFESDVEILRVSGPAKLSKTVKSEGEQSLKVFFTTDKYSTVSIENPLGNWRGYKVFALDIFNPEFSPLRLVLRISDQQHDQGNQALTDRFNAVITLKTGWNELKFNMHDIQQAPHDRELNLEKITNIAIFSSALSSPRIAYIDNIRLEN